jgi:small ligand-binding sensory domain FIST
MRARFASAHAEGESFFQALGDAANRALEELGGDAPDIAFLFASPEFGDALEEAPERLIELTGASAVVGCSGAGVCERSGEFEQGRVLSLLLGRIPAATIGVTELHHDDLLGLAGPEALRDVIGVDRTAGPSFVVLADPFTVEPGLLLSRLNDAYPGAAMVGGLASGVNQPGGNVLFAGEHSTRAGAVVVSLTGLPMRPVVAQGCRPVGRRFVITRCEGNKIFSLSGRPALNALHEELAGLPDADRAIARSNLLIGRVICEEQADFSRGDFLVRNFLGVVPEEGAVLIGDTVRVGQTVQLQLRDGASAGADLVELLDEAGAGGAPTAALLFSCGGRGRRMFGEPDHDVTAVRERFGDIPLAGFFCSGEIGSVGARGFLHGFTASLALF